MAERKAERAKAAERTRDAQRTKEAILVAAEDRFARLGFEGTSLQQIGEAAGVARSTPAYFFRSKEALYDAVLARAVARAQEAMAHAYADEDGDRSAEEAAETYVSAFLDFLGHDQNFVRLIQREALEDASRVAEFFGRFVEEAAAVLKPAAEKAGISPERLVLDLAAHLLVSVRERAHAHARARDAGPRPRLPRPAETAPRRSSASDDTFQVISGQLREIDAPVVGEDEMLVRMHAASVDQGVWHLMGGLPYLVRIAGVGLRAPKQPRPRCRRGGARRGGRREREPRMALTSRFLRHQAYPGKGTWRARQQRLGFLAQEPVEKRA